MLTFEERKCHELIKIFCKNKLKDMAQLFQNKIVQLLKLKISTSQGNFCNIHNLKHSNRYITSTPKYLKSICWKCGKQRTENFFCENCNIIQKPPEEENYFNIFGIQEKFDVDTVELANRFKQLQWLVHPDKFSTKSNEEKHISEEYSSLLNKAYSYLQTPLKRAEYLLGLKGEAISDSDTSQDPAFLMEMMTLNEEVEDAKYSPDQLKSLDDKNKKELDKLTMLIDESFKNGNLLGVKKYVVKMKYHMSLRERINNYLREMGVTE